MRFHTGFVHKRPRAWRRARPAPGPEAPRWRQAGRPAGCAPSGELLSWPTAFPVSASPGLAFVQTLPTKTPAQQPLPGALAADSPAAGGTDPGSQRTRGPVRPALGPVASWEVSKYSQKQSEGVSQAHQLRPFWKLPSRCPAGPQPGQQRAGPSLPSARFPGGLCQAPGPALAAAPPSASPSPRPRCFTRDVSRGHIGAARLTPC